MPILLIFNKMPVKYSSLSNYILKEGVPNKDGIPWGKKNKPAVWLSSQLHVCSLSRQLANWPAIEALRAYFPVHIPTEYYKQIQGEGFINVTDPTVSQKALASEADPFLTASVWRWSSRDYTCGHCFDPLGDPEASPLLLSQHQCQ